LISLIAVGIFGGKLETRWEVLTLGLGHFAPICFSKLWRARQLERTKVGR
jgi:hypothetical protein